MTCLNIAIRPVPVDTINRIVPQHLFVILDRHNVGDQVTVEFLRDGRRQQASITLVPIE